MNNESLAKLAALKDQFQKKREKESKTNPALMPRRCPACKRAFTPPKHLEKSPPNLCYSCWKSRGYNKKIKKHHTKVRDDIAPYRSVKVFQGGAPGLGKNH